MKSLLEILDDRFQEFGNRTALSEGEREVSYRELDEWSRSLTNQILHHDREPGAYLVEIPRSIEAIVAFVAIIRAGGWYVPIDLKAPRSRNAGLAESVKPKGTLITNDDDSSSGAHRITVAFPDFSKPSPVIAGEPRRNAESPAYVIFTSGSTGSPKGVIVPDRGIIRLVVDPDYVRISSEDTVLHFAAPTFDAATFEIWGALLNGAKLAILRDTMPSASQFQRFFETERPTIAWLTSGLFNTLIDTNPQCLATLKQLLAGGEALSVQHIQKGLRLLQDTTFINGYGPTENTTFTCCYQIPRSLSEVELQNIPIGRPIRGTTVKIVDESLQPVEEGEAGELITGGEGLALGYLQDEKLTKARFVRKDGKTYYRTGDLVRQNQSGEIEFLGRMDDQVKINGFRIEPGEISHHLKELDGIKDAAVIAHKLSNGQKRLVAYVARASSGNVVESTLQQNLKEHLPPYMIPARIIILDELPLNRNGKVDRSQLLNPFSLETTNTRTDSSSLKTIVEGILGANSFDPASNFAQIGGDSLTALQISSRVREELGRSLPICEILSTKPLGELQSKPLAPRDRNLSNSPHSENEFPLSALQRQVWYLARQATAIRAYYVTCQLNFGPEIDRDCLHQSLEDLFRSQPILHANLKRYDTESPYWSLQPNQPLPYEYHDLSDLDPVDFESRVDDEIEKACYEELSLDDTPLVRWIAWDSGEKGLRLLQLEHHLIHDGWSLGHLLLRWSQAYEARARNENPRLETGHPYSEFAKSIEQSDSLTDDHPSLLFWKEKLQGLVETPLTPCDASARISEVGRALRKEIPKEVVHEIAQLAKSESTTPFLCYLTAFVATLLKTEDTRRLAIGLGVANRTNPLFEGTLGMFVNMVVLAIETGTDVPTWSRLREIVGSSLNEVLDHQSIPFQRVVQTVNPPRTPGRNPFFEILFSMHQRPDLSESFGGNIESCVEALDNGTAKFDLNAFVIQERSKSSPEETRAWLRWEYRVGRFRHSHMESLMDLCLEHLKASLQGDLTIADFPASVPRKTFSPTSQKQRTTREKGEESQLYQMVKAAWEKQFPGELLTSESNFFSVGGHSLLSVRLIADLERVLKREIPLTLIFEAPVLQDFVNRLAEEDSGEAFSFTRLNQTSGNPMILMHGWGGVPHVFDTLVGHIGSKIPLASLHADPRSAEQFEDLDQLSEAYAQKLIEENNSESFSLCGYSLGGTIAWATALALQKRGKKIDHLVMIDTMPPVLPEYLRTRAKRRFLLKRMIKLGRDWFRTPVSKWPLTLKRKLHALQGHIKGHAHLKPEEISRNLPEGFQLESDPYQKLTESWHPQRFQGDINLLWTPDDGIELPSCWRYWAGGKVIETPLSGTHLELLEGDSVRQVADLVCEAMQL